MSSLSALPGLIFYESVILGKLTSRRMHFLLCMRKMGHELGDKLHSEILNGHKQMLGWTWWDEGGASNAGLPPTTSKKKTEAAGVERDQVVQRTVSDLHR